MRILFGALLFFMVLGVACQAELYVHNKLYDKPTLVYKGVIYAAVDDLFKTLQMKSASQGRVLCGGTPDYTGDLCPPNSSHAFLYINGKPISEGVMVRHEKAYISVATLASAVGLTYQYNPQTGIGDLSGRFNESLINTDTKETKKQDKNTKAKTETKKSDKDKKDKPKETKEEETLIEVQNLSKMYQPNTNEMWVSFNVVNTGKKDAAGVVATLQYLDGYGKPLVEKTFNIGSLASGASVKEDDYWQNPSGVYAPTPVVILNWDGKKKEK